MTDILSNATNDALLLAAEANAIASNETLVVYFAGGETHYEGGLIWFSAPLPVTQANKVLHTDLADDVAESGIARVVASQQERGRPLSWWVWPHSRPADLGERLTAHGLQMRVEYPLMAADLDAITLLPTPAAVEVRVVQSAADLQEWFVPFTAGFGIPEQIAKLLRERAAQIDDATDLPLRNYVAWREGMPIAAATMSLSGGVAGLYNVAVVPAARRQGSGAAITLAALQDAQAMGYRYAVLESSALGYGIYQHIGFRELCKVANYLMDAASA